MTLVAAAGVVVNVAAAWVLAKANRQSLNVEGSLQHIITDLYAFVGTLIAGIVILVTGFNRADAIASLLVAGLMFRSGYGLQRKCIRVLLEGAPEGMAPGEVGVAMAHAAADRARAQGRLAGFFATHRVRRPADRGARRPGGEDPRRAARTRTPVQSSAA